MSVTSDTYLEEHWAKRKEEGPNERREETRDGIIDINAERFGPFPKTWGNGLERCWVEKTRRGRQRVAPEDENNGKQEDVTVSRDS